MNRFWRPAAASCLLILAVAGIVHGVRASASAFFYHRAKYGAPSRDCRAALPLCESAFRLGPRSYAVCLYGTESAFKLVLDRRGGELPPELIEQLRKWCERGLRLNPHKKQLRFTEMWLESRQSVLAARDSWTRYMEWDFWEPDNHRILLELHLAVGDYSSALDELRWLRHTPLCDGARKRVREAWAAEMAVTVPAGMPSERPRQ
jgi:hypothetical protein